jgi:hypothetical protein
MCIEAFSWYEVAAIGSGRGILGYAQSVINLYLAALKLSIFNLALLQVQV